MSSDNSDSDGEVIQVFATPNLPTRRGRGNRGLRPGSQTRQASDRGQPQEEVSTYCHLDFSDQVPGQSASWAHNDPFCAMCHAGLYAFCFGGDATRGHDVREVGGSRYEIIFRGGVGVRSDSLEFRNSSWITSVAGCGCCIHVGDCVCAGIFFVFVNSFESYRFEGTDCIVVVNCRSVLI